MGYPSLTADKSCVWHFDAHRSGKTKPPPSPIIAYFVWDHSKLANVRDRSLYRSICDSQGITSQVLLSVNDLAPIAQPPLSAHRIPKHSCAPLSTFDYREALSNCYLW